MTEIFVFGSNLAGRHGKGAALGARNKYGAVTGVGVGFRGSSYAIPTKDWDIKTLPLEKIEYYVAQFIAFAVTHPHKTFRLTPIGCGLAGYSPKQIAPMFANAPANVLLPEEFKAFLND